MKVKNQVKEEMSPLKAESLKLVAMGYLALV